ncbi:hypothetical protein [Nostoc sp.]|uniref:hypothetical protein n=1 Tax=Nostoc sp. TaxID=1180 RepID=UPI002FF8B4E9
MTNNPQVIYYNAELEGKNRADEFLINICTQLINQYSLNYTFLPDNATYGVHTSREIPPDTWFRPLAIEIVRSL